MPDAAQRCAHYCQATLLARNGATHDVVSALKVLCVPVRHRAIVRSGRPAVHTVRAEACALDSTSVRARAARPVIKQCVRRMYVTQQQMCRLAGGPVYDPAACAGRVPQHGVRVAASKEATVAHDKNISFSFGQTAARVQADTALESEARRAAATETAAASCGSAEACGVAPAAERHATQDTAHPAGAARTAANASRERSGAAAVAAPPATQSCSLAGERDVRLGDKVDPDPYAPCGRAFTEPADVPRVGGARAVDFVRCDSASSESEHGAVEELEYVQTTSALARSASIATTDPGALDAVARSDAADARALAVAIAEGADAAAPLDEPRNAGGGSSAVCTQTPSATGDELPRAAGGQAVVAAPTSAAVPAAAVLAPVVEPEPAAALPLQPSVVAVCTKTALVRGAAGYEAHVKGLPVRTLPPKMTCL